MVNEWQLGQLEERRGRRRMWTDGLVEEMRGGVWRRAGGPRGAILFTSLGCWMPRRGSLGSTDEIETVARASSGTGGSIFLIHADGWGVGKRPESLWGWVEIESKSRVRSVPC